MKNRILPLLILITSFSFYASAQTTGDYRSNNNNFNWNTDASWQRWNGTAWADPTTGGFGYPGENATGIAGTVTIQNGHTVSANTDVTTNDIGNLILSGSGILNYNNTNIDIEATGNLTMDGTSQIQGTNSNRTLKIAGSFFVPVTATNARIQYITLTIAGNTTINGSLELTSTFIMDIGGNLNLLGAGILFMNAGSQDIDVTGNLTMDGTSQIRGDGSSRNIQIGNPLPSPNPLNLTYTSTFTVPLTATNARIAGVTFTMYGNTTVAGILTFNDNDGVKSFNGRVTVSGSWTSTAITTNNRLVFTGEIITSGVFACGCN